MAEKGKRRKAPEPSVAYEMIAPPISGGELGALLSAFKANVQSKRGDWKRSLAAMAGVPGMDKEDIPLYGLGQSVMSLPSVVSLINPDLAPDFSVEAERRYSDLVNKQLAKHGLPSSEELFPLEKVALAGGEMLSQLPVPESVFAKAAKVVPKALKPINLATEYFGPVIEPSAKSYLVGTGIGGGLRIATDVPEEEPREPQELYAYPDPRFFAQIGEPTRKFGGGGLARAARRLSEPSVKFSQPLQIMKEPGGQWVTGFHGGIEKELNRLKENIPTTAVSPEQEKRSQAMGKWIDTTLAKYIKRDLATEKDPVRALAEKGITHVPNKERLEQSGKYGSGAASKTRRERAGMPADLLGVSDLAKGWEDLSDASVDGGKAGLIIQHSPVIDRILKDNPWMKDVDPETRINMIGVNSQIGNLGFSHLRDELQNAMSQNSGLPHDLQLRPESLQRMSMPQAVEHVAKINDWRAEQIQKARLESQPDTDLVKDYPKEKMRWVQLNKPGQFAYESDAMGHSVRGYEPDEDAGYGLGGWPAIESGKAKIYSLRDDRGEPHVTIEVSHEDDVPSITQVKGKSNKAPKDEYVPFIQDFIKSGDFRHVDDFENTGLVDLENLQEPERTYYFKNEDKYKSAAGKYLEKHGKIPRFLNYREFMDPESWVPQEEPKKFSKGGSASLHERYGLPTGKRASALSKKYL